MIKMTPAACSESSWRPRSCVERSGSDSTSPRLKNHSDGCKYRVLLTLLIFTTIYKSSQEVFFIFLLFKAKLRIWVDLTRIWIRPMTKYGFGSSTKEGFITLLLRPHGCLVFINEEEKCMGSPRQTDILDINGSVK